MKELKHYMNLRRQKLLNLVKGNDVLLILAPPVYIRTADQHHDFRQSSDFLYLTNWEKENSALLFHEGKFNLFIEKPTPMRLLWDGHVPDIDEAKVITGIDNVFYKEELPSHLSKFKNKNLHYDFGKHAANDKFVLEYAWNSITSTQNSVGILRMIKDEYEISMLKKSCEISALGHKDAWQKLRPGMNESDFSLEIEFAFRKHGAQRNAYGPIIAGGKNATCLHYSSNNQKLNENELLLVDAAGEYNYYASDITRTFPINGWKSGGTHEQQIIYQIVLEAQLKSIAIAKIGMRPMEQHKQTIEWLKEGLLKNGILKDPEHIKKLYPHGTGHWLGLDVHDESPREINGEAVEYVPGMVFTVEPGLYFYAEMAEIYPKFAGIGIRIEDDILITENEPVVMTAAIGK